MSNQTTIGTIPDVTDYTGTQTTFNVRLRHDNHTVITGQTTYDTGTVTRHFTIDIESKRVIETIIDMYNDGTQNQYEILTPLNNIPIPGVQILGDEAIASITTDNEKAGSIRFRDHAFNKHYRQPKEYDEEQTDTERLNTKPDTLTKTTRPFEQRQLQPKQQAFGWNTTITFTPTENGMRVTALYESPTDHIATGYYTLNTETRTITINSPKHQDTKTLSLTKHGHVDIDYESNDTGTIKRVAEPHDELFEYRYLSGFPLSFPRFAWYHAFDTHHYLTEHVSYDTDSKVNRYTNM